MSCQTHPPWHPLSQTTHRALNQEGHHAGQLARPLIKSCYTWECHTEHSKQRCTPICSQFKKTKQKNKWRFSKKWTSVSTSSVRNFVIFLVSNLFNLRPDFIFKWANMTKSLCGPLLAMGPAWTVILLAEAVTDHCQADHSCRSTRLTEAAEAETAWSQTRTLPSWWATYRAKAQPQ